METSHPRTRSAELGEIDVSWLDWGDPEGPLAVLVHGFPDAPNTWRHLGPRLAAVGHHVVAPWLRGYAPTSVPPSGNYRMGTLAADLHALVDHLGASDPVLIGHDWGAIVGYTAVATDPERWRRLVTMAVPPLGAVMAGFLTFAQVRRSWYIFVFQHPLAEGIVSGDDLHFIDELWHEWSPGYDPVGDLPEVKAALRDPANLAAAIGYYRAMLSTDPPDDATPADQAGYLPMPIPTLYLHGQDDGCMGVEVAAGASAALPAEGSRVEFLDGVGHFLHLEDPDRVDALILDFLKP